MKEGVLILPILLFPNSVKACMMEPAPEAIVFETRPSSVAPGFIVVKGSISNLDAAEWRLDVLVLEGPKSLQRKIIKVVPTSLSSCVGIGRTEGYLSIKSNGEPARESYFLAQTYHRSWFDWIFDFFGADPYYFSGSQSDSII
jgi:hypothetical protein